jgi:hypothetical protein
VRSPIVILDGDDAARLKHSPHLAQRPRVISQVLQQVMGETSRRLRPLVVIPIAGDHPYCSERCSALGLAQVVGPDERTPDPHAQRKLWCALALALA